MLHVVLFEPEIPPNTGNIIRLCANTGAILHLIRPLGFELNDKHLRRAGLDYYALANVEQHDDFAAFCATKKRLIACSTKGATTYTDIQYQDEDALIFGPETRGLPQDFLNSLPKGQVIRIPMLSSSRSLNLSNAVAVIVYEAWRQMGFSG